MDRGEERAGIKWRDGERGYGGKLVISLVPLVCIFVRYQEKKVQPSDGPDGLLVLLTVADFFLYNLVEQVQLAN